MRSQKLLNALFVIVTSLFLMAPPSHALSFQSASKTIINYIAPITKTSSINVLEQSQKHISTMNTEITDPNFNKMRNKDTKKSFAIVIVIGLLIVATIVPLVIWRSLSN